MVSFEEAANMLDEIAGELPQAFYDDLNGGVYLLPETKTSSQSRTKDPLYVLGDYNVRRDLGKYINLYYGSFAKIYSHLPPAKLKEELRRVLIHEFTHHVEYLAGERGLQIKDAREMEKYLRS